MTTLDKTAVEAACEASHDAYELAALKNGWATNPRSRKPWADVPEENKATVRAGIEAAITAYLDILSSIPEQGVGVKAWQWSDFSGKWYTVDTARLTIAEQEELARTVAKDHEGRVRPLYATPPSPHQPTLRYRVKGDLAV